MLKLNNPGNIRISSDSFRGEVRPSAHPSFCQFQTMADGYRAMFVIIRTYMRKYGLRTIDGIISRWAPPSENDTRAYIATVARLSGINACRSLTFCKQDLAPVVSAMSLVENGVKADPQEVEKGWEMVKKS